MGPKHIPHAPCFHLLNSRLDVLIQNTIPSRQCRHIERTSHLKGEIDPGPSCLKKELSPVCMHSKPAHLLVYLGSRGEPPTRKLTSRASQSAFNRNLANGYAHQSYRCSHEQYTTPALQPSGGPNSKDNPRQGDREEAQPVNAYGY